MITNSQEYLSSRVRSLESINNELRFKIQELHREIIQIIQTSPTNQPSSSISQKEAEMKNLTDKLLDLERQNIQKRIHLFIDDHGGYINPLLQGRLRDWYHSLGEYRQLQIQQSISPEAFMSIIYSEFIGSPWEHTAHAREEFLKMKCCSFQKKDLEKHYDRMSQRFYCLNGVDDVNLKQVFLNSFPESLGNEAYRALEARMSHRKTPPPKKKTQTTLGELYQLILNALAKLCNQKKFLAEFERTGKRLGTACDDKYLQIKCKDKSSCDCTHTKKKFHSKRFSSLSGKPRFSRRSSKKWKFIRKKKQRGRTSDRCFICQKRGHFARNCFRIKKRSQALIQALNQVEPVDVSDLESLYSLDDEPSDSVLCTIAYSDFSSDDDSDTDSLESDSDFGVHMINPIPPRSLTKTEGPPLPLTKVHLLTDAYAKPIPVIAFFDTGSSVSILNPNILPNHYWKPHHHNFMAVNGEICIDKISVPM
ncbi:putative zinc finger, CCHC-type containing protein [Tanacetum coccineum]